RSLLPLGLVVLLVLGWTVLPGAPWFWTALALLVLGLPLVLRCAGAIQSLAGGGAPLAVLRDLAGDLGPTVGHLVLATVFLLDQARLSVNAIVRTLFRMYWGRRQLLEWETASATERRLGAGLVHFGLTMWPTVLLAAGLGLVVLLAPGSLPAAVPLLA